MQEEVTQKTIVLSIQTAKLTASVLQKALKKLLAAQKKKSPQLHKGKQTMRQLMKHNTGVSNYECEYQENHSPEPALRTVPMAV